MCLVVGTVREGKFKNTGVREVSERMRRRRGGEKDGNQLSAGGGPFFCHEGEGKGGCDRGRRHADLTAR